MKLKKNSNKYAFRIFFVFLFSMLYNSCTTANANINNLTIEDYTSKKEIIEKSKLEVFLLFDEQIIDENIGVYKRGKNSNWNVILFGDYRIYTVIIDNFGNLINIESTAYK